MTDRPYQIEAEPARRLVTMSFDPVFWDEEVADAFIRDCLTVVSSIGCEPAELLILVDLRHAVLQSRIVYDRVLRLLRSSVARKVALVASSPLARMQTKRLQVPGRVVLFDDVPAAEQWLFDNAVSAAA